MRLHELALELLGPHAELVDGEHAAWMKGYQFALAGPIYAGTNEIQRNVVAERVLGVARDEVRLLRRPARVPRRAARPAQQGVHGGARARRVDERHRPRAGSVDSARRDGRRRVARARGRRRPGPGVRRPRAAARGDGPARGPRADRRNRRDGCTAARATPSLVVAAAHEFVPVGRHRRRHLHCGRTVRSRDRNADTARVGRRCPPAVRRDRVGTARHRRRRRRVRPRRARRRRAAVRVGRSHAGTDRRLREGAPAVRRARRFLPGGEAPSRERTPRARVRTPARVPRRGHPRPRAREHGQAQSRRRRPHDGQGRAPVPRRDRLHHRVRPASVHETGVGARREAMATPASTATG